MQWLPCALVVGGDEHNLRLTPNLLTKVSVVHTVLQARVNVVVRHEVLEARGNVLVRHEVLQGVR